MQGIALRLAGSTSSRAAVHNLRPLWTRKHGLHTRVDPYKFDAGVGAFLSAAALKTIAVEYQQGLLDRLNEQVRGTDLEHKSVTQTVIEAANHPDLVLTYNYASEALNNSFFLHSLTPDSKTSNEDGISGVLAHSIRANFMSLEELKSRFGATALGMFNSGYVWLVCDATGGLAVLPTFGTETLLIRSRQLLNEHRTTAVIHPSHKTRTTSNSAPSALSSTSGASQPSLHVPPSAPSRPFSHSATSHNARDSPASFDNIGSLSSRITRTSGDAVYPLMCLSVHEHAWMSAGYGVWGKEEYIKRLWPVVNWKAVSKAYEKFKVTTSKLGTENYTKERMIN